MTVDVEFDALTLEATGGDGTYVDWSISEGALPAGLALNRSEGIVSGLPTIGVFFNFEVRVEDRHGNTGAQVFRGRVYPVPPPQPIDINYSLGCIYMPKPSYPSQFFGTQRLNNMLNPTKKTGSQRRALLGDYQGDNPEVLDWQIKWAVEHGIDFFLFNEWWTESYPEPIYNESLSAFLSARYRNTMQFAVALCGVESVDTSSERKRDLFVNLFIRHAATTYFSLPNYLLVDERPVVSVLGWSSAFGLRDLAEIKRTLDEADSLISSLTAFPGAYWMTGDINQTTTDPDSTAVDFAHAATAGFHGVAPYYVLPYLWPPMPKVSRPIQIAAKDQSINLEWPAGLRFGGDGTSREVPLESRDRHEASFVAAGTAGVTFLTALAADFDSRKAYQEAGHFFWEGQDSAAYWRLLSLNKSVVDSNIPLAPVASRTAKPMVGLGPWNEWTENDSIEPGWGAFQDPLVSEDPFLMVGAVAKMFGGPTSGYDHRLPGDYSRGRPVRSEWSFRPTGSDIEFWSPTATGALYAGPNGECVVRFDRKQVALYSVTNVDTAHYSRIEVLFHLVSGGPLSKIQFHWWSTDYSMEADAFRSSTEPDKQIFMGNVGTGAHLYSCVNDEGLFSCEMPLAGNPMWRDRLELVRINFILDVVASTQVNLHRIALLP